MTADARRRWLGVLRIALAAVLLMVAAWPLLTFQAVRDRLGHWQVTVSDDHGAVLGRGGLDLSATAWNVRWVSAPPFVNFLPRLADPAGRITLTPAGETALAKLNYRGASIACARPILTRDWMYCDGIGEDRSLLMGFSLNFHGRNGSGKMSYNGISLPGTGEYPVTLTR